MEKKIVSYKSRRNVAVSIDLSLTAIAETTSLHGVWTLLFSRRYSTPVFSAEKTRPKDWV
jgi:hypothetical protein